MVNRLASSRFPSTAASPILRGRSRHLAWAVAAGFVATLVFCCWHEPLAYDAWGHYLYRQQVPASWGDVWTQARESYLHGNPRLGQVITVLLYIDALHRVLTPAVLVFVLLACCYLVAGRWPRLTRGGDWDLLALVTALLLVLVGNVGMMFFYRPYVGNYVYGFALYLALLLPYRRALERGLAPTRWWWAALAALGMLGLGIAAGLTNEHTGPAVLAGIVGGGLWTRARARRAGGRCALAAWMIAGVVGVAIGYAALLLAPGQLERYDGMGREPLTRWVIERGWGNATLLAVGLAPLAPALVAWALLRTAPRRGLQRQLVALYLAAALLVCATLLLSPKVGLRLFWPATVLQVIATVTWFGPTLLSSRLRGWTLRCSVLVIAGHALVFAQAYAERAAEQEARLRLLRAAPPGAEVVLPCYRPRSMRYLVSDDVRWPHTQQQWRDVFGVTTRAAGSHCAPIPATTRR